MPYTTGMYVPIYGEPRHLWVEGAPTIVAPIGQSVDVRPPRPLVVPTDPNELQATVANAVNELVVATRYGLQDSREAGDPLHSEDAAAREAPRNWLVQADNGWAIHPDALGATAFVSAAANRLLPPFLGERYRIVVALRPLDRWTDGTGRHWRFGCNSATQAPGSSTSR